MMILILLQEAQKLEGVNFWAVAERAAWVVGGMIALAGAYLLLRAKNHQITDEVNEKAITALQALITTRDLELTEKDCEIEELAESKVEILQQCEVHTAELDAVRAELKVQSGIVLSDLLQFHATMETHLVELDMEKSRRRAAESRESVAHKHIEALEKELADQKRCG